MINPPRFKDALETFARHDVELDARYRDRAGRDKDLAVLDLLRQALSGSR